MNKILLYNSGGGLGDSIQLFPLILSLQNHFKTSKFYYLGAHKNHFKGKLKEYGIKIDTFDLDLKYFGFRWWHFLVVKKLIRKKNIDKIDLIIDLQSKLRNTLILKQIPHKHFYSSTYKFKFCSKKGNYLPKDHLVNLNEFLGTKIITLNYDFQKLEKKFLIEAKNILPKQNYIGFSLTQGNLYREKTWSIEKFITLAKRAREKNLIPVFFIEKDQVNLISKIKSEVPNALFPESISSISCPALVTALATRLNLSVSIDNGIMHMIGLSKTPMIVIFGPTDPEKFAPKNTQIKILDSKKLYNTKDINSISVEDVFNFI